MSLAEWYENREILITGVTSEVGRLLLEKILRTLPNVKVSAIVRSRDGLSKDERLKRIFHSPGYKRLAEQNPNAMNLVKTYEGNLLYDNIGLSPEDCEKLKNVEVVFHASGSLDYVYEFCRTELPKLRVLAVATDLYQHENLSENTLDNMKIIKDIPLALLRLPTIGPAFQEPMPGFVEILRGPTALMIGAGFALGRRDLPAEVLPVDLAVNALIAAAWERGIREKNDEPAIYNAPNLGCTWDDLLRSSKLARMNFSYPTFGISGMTSIASLHWLIVFIFEWLPSILCDTVLSICGAKPRCIVEYEKVRKTLQSLEKTTLKPLTIERSAIYRLEERLTFEDREKYRLQGSIDLEAYVVCAAASAKKNCINESNARLMKNLKILLLTFLVITMGYFLMMFWK